MLETTLLYTPPRTLDPDHYPLLTITSSLISHPPTPRSPQPGPPADLFTVLANGPFRLTGILGTIPRKHHNSLVRIDAALKHPAITVQKVETYALERKRVKRGMKRRRRGVGEAAREGNGGGGEDEYEIVIWVLGQSAWYRVEDPVEEFQEVFGEMKRKAEVWMWLKQEIGPGGMRDGSVAEIYKQYAQSHAEEFRTPRAAGKHLNNYWKFLVQMMLESEEAAEWRQSCLWKEFEMIHKDELEEILASSPTLAAASSAAQTSRARTPRTPAPRRSRRRQNVTASPPPPGTTLLIVPNDPPTTTHGTSVPSSPFSSSSSTSSSEDEDDDEEEEEDDEDSHSDSAIAEEGAGLKTPSHPARGRRRSGKSTSKGRSILRPALRSDIPLAPASDDDGDDDDADDIATPLPAPRRKRKLASEEMDIDDDNGDNHAHDNDNDNSNQDAASAGTLKRTLQATKTSERDWTCSKCGYLVPNARTRDGRHAVEEHYKTHAGVWVEALRTVEMEKVRGAKRKVGVDNLLNKLMEMNRKWEEERRLSPLKGLE